MGNISEASNFQYLQIIAYRILHDSCFTTNKLPPQPSADFYSVRLAAAASPTRCSLDTRSATFDRNQREVLGSLFQLGFVEC